MTDGQYITIPQASRRFSISANTFRQWIRRGRLTAYDKTLGSRRKCWIVAVSDVLALLANHRSHAPRGRVQRGNGMAVITQEWLAERGITGRRRRVG